MRTSEVSFLIAAAILHAAIPVMAHVVPRPETPMVAQSVYGRTEIEVEIDQFVPPPEERAAIDLSRVREPALEPREARRERRVEPGSERATPDPYAPDDNRPSPEAAPVPTGSNRPPPDEFDPIAPGDGPGAGLAPPGLGGPPVWTLPGVLPKSTGPAPAPTTAPAPTPVDRNMAGRVLEDVRRAKDKQLGLDLPAAGTVASVVGDAVRATETPGEARATFEVRLSPTGRVLGVRVVSSSAGSSDAWERAARAALSRLAGRAFTMTGVFAAGATVYVDVTSAILMPDGSKGGVHRQGPGFSFDLSNIGAGPSRVVRTSFRAVPSK